MQLAEAISTETGVPVKQILLLRHSTDSIKVLKKCGATIEEYTALQPVGSKYDFYRDSTNQSRIVIVIVDDHVYGAFEIRGIARTGSNYDLASDQYILFDKSRDKPPRHCRFFDLKAVPTSVTGQKITGWEGRSRTPVQRYGDKFFHEVSIVGQQKLIPATSLSVEFTDQIEAALLLSQNERLEQIGTDERIPRKIAVVSYEYERSPLVVAAALSRANGKCELCQSPAPFIRRSNQTPYLEVHHITKLADGGFDTIANAIAVCPNCHRKAHYGDA